MSRTNYIALGYLNNAPRTPPFHQGLNEACFPTLLQIQRHCFLEDSHPFLAPNFAIQYFSLALGRDNLGVAPITNSSAFAVADTANGTRNVPNLISLCELQHDANSLTKSVGPAVSYSFWKVASVMPTIWSPEDVGEAARLPGHSWTRSQLS
jgi:hypothetical protein